MVNSDFGHVNSNSWAILHRCKKLSNTFEFVAAEACGSARRFENINYLNVITPWQVEVNMEPFALYSQWTKVSER